MASAGRTDQEAILGSLARGGNVSYGMSPAMQELANLGLLPRRMPSYTPPRGFGQTLSNIAGVADRFNPQRAIGAIEERALTSGQSPWAQMMTQQQRLGQQKLAEQATQGVQGAQSAALSSLARKGGLSSGARERAVLGGQRNLQMGLQDVARQGAMDRLNIGIEDERQKLNLLQGLPGAYAQGTQTALSPWSEIARVGLGESELRNRTVQDLFNTQMQAYAATQTGRAMNPGGSQYQPQRYQSGTLYQPPLYQGAGSRMLM